MFRPPSLLVSQIVPTAAVLPQGSRDFYFRAERASLPLHAPDMLTVRIQVIDGVGCSSFLPAIQATGLGLLPRWDFHPLVMPAFAGRTHFGTNRFLDERLVNLSSSEELS
jgi:hypothetical protein